MREGVFSEPRSRAIAAIRRPPTRDEWFLIGAFAAFMAGTNAWIEPKHAWMAVLPAVVAAAAAAIGMRARSASGIRNSLFVGVTTASCLLWGLFVTAPALVAIVALAWVAAIPRLRSIGWVAVAAIFAVIIATIHGWFVWGSSAIDLFPILQGGSNAVLHGSDPYRSSYIVHLLTNDPNHVYTAPFAAPYGPAVFIALAPLRPLGDVRLTEFIFLAATVAYVIRKAARAGMPQNQQRLAAIFLLASPLAALMATNGWTEVLAVLPLAIWWRHRSGSPLFGLLLVPVFDGKPTLMLLVAAVWIFEFRPVWRSVAVGVVASVAVAMPFVLDLGLRTYVTDVTSVFGTSMVPEPQWNSVTIDALLYRVGLSPLPRLVGAALIVCGIVLALWLVRRQRDATNIAALGIVLSTISFVLAPYAHINYFWPLGIWLMLLVANASSDHSDGAREVTVELRGRAVAWLQHHEKLRVSHVPGAAVEAR